LKAFIIIEDYEPEHIEETLKHVLPYYYSEYQAALDALHEIARDLGVTVEPDDWSFAAPPESGIYRDSYYIMELDRG